MKQSNLFNGKVCSRCNEHKPYTDFHREKKSLDGRVYKCKLCVSDYQKELRRNPPIKDENNKYCLSCKCIKPVVEFRKRKNSKGEYKLLNSNCILCENLKCLQWREEDREKARLSVRKHELKRRYGITLEEYDRMKFSQNNLCAICGGVPDGYNSRKNRLLVDHCHKTNKIRGLLCSTCNTMIGMAKDDISILENAIKYLTTN